MQNFTDNTIKNGQADSFGLFSSVHSSNANIFHKRNDHCTVQLEEVFLYNLKRDILKRASIPIAAAAAIMRQ